MSEKDRSGGLVLRPTGLLGQGSQLSGQIRRRIDDRHAARRDEAEARDPSRELGVLVGRLALHARATDVRKPAILDGPQRDGERSRDLHKASRIEETRRSVRDRCETSKDGEGR